MQGGSRQYRQGSQHSRQTRAQQIHDRRFTLVIITLALAVVATAVASYSSRVEASSDAASAEPDISVSTTLDPTAALCTATYTAELTGDYETVGKGQALLTLHYDADFDTLSYVLEITTSLGSPSVAAICQGSPDESGATVFTLYAGPTVAGNFTGMLAQGYINASDLTGPLQGEGLADLAVLLESGEAYATIGTTTIPVDAVRAQLQ